MKTLQHKFVEFIPDEIEEGLIYISIEYTIVVHKCACGCGNEVVTPLAPTGWELRFDGKNVSLNPSIGNWSFECRSHYWIVKNRIRHARRWSDFEIKQGRKHDEEEVRKYFKGTEDVN